MASISAKDRYFGSVEQLLSMAPPRPAAIIGFKISVVASGNFLR
jgi:hypothetical protein